MRARTNRNRTTTRQFNFYFVATSSLLALALLLSSWASTSHAYGPELEIINFEGIDLGYYDTYNFVGSVTNAEDPTALEVTIYINGNPAGTCHPNASGDFGLVLMCSGGEVRAECFQSPVLAVSKIVTL